MSSDRTISLKDSQNSVRRWRRLHWVSAVNRARSLAPSCRRNLLSPPPHATCLASHRSRLSSSPREPAHACDVFECCNECGRVSFAASDQMSHTQPLSIQHNTAQCMRLLTSAFALGMKVTAQALRRYSLSISRSSSSLSHSCD